jgi:hypothetical protein
MAPKRAGSQRPGIDALISGRGCQPSVHEFESRLPSQTNLTSKFFGVWLTRSRRHVREKANTHGKFFAILVNTERQNVREMANSCEKASLTSVNTGGLMRAQSASATLVQAQTLILSLVRALVVNCRACRIYAEYFAIAYANLGRAYQIVGLEERMDEALRNQVKC